MRTRAGRRRQWTELELVRQARRRFPLWRRAELKRRRKFDRHAKRWCYGDRARKPGQLVQIDHTGVAIEAGFCVKESGAVCPVSKLCYMRAYSRASAASRCEFHQFYADELSVGILSACRPHQALGQTAPMQAYNQNFNQSALAA